MRTILLAKPLLRVESRSVQTHAVAPCNAAKYAAGVLANATVIKTIAPHRTVRMWMQWSTFSNGETKREWRKMKRDEIVFNCGVLVGLRIVVT